MSTQNSVLLHDGDAGNLVVGKNGTDNDTILWYWKKSCSRMNKGGS